MSRCVHELQDCRNNICWGAAGISRSTIILVINCPDGGAVIMGIRPYEFPIACDHAPIGRALRPWEAGMTGLSNASRSRRRRAFIVVIAVSLVVGVFSGWSAAAS
jgi:hypothetical protein